MAGAAATNERFTGPAYPFGPDVAGALGPKPDVNVIYTSISNIITTPKGSVPHNPRMGSVVPDLMFDINDEVTRQLVRYYTEKDLREQEPRIVVLAVYTEQPASDESAIIVTVAFRIVGDPTETVYSAPVLYPSEA